MGLFFREVLFFFTADFFAVAAGFRAVVFFDVVRFAVVRFRLDFFAGMYSSKLVTSHVPNRR